MFCNIKKQIKLYWRKVMHAMIVLTMLFPNRYMKVKINRFLIKGAFTSINTPINTN